MLGDYIAFCAFIIAIGACMCRSLNKCGYDFKPLDVLLLDLFGIGVFSVSFGFVRLFFDLL